MTDFEEKIRVFDESMCEKSNQEIEGMAREFWAVLSRCVHCEGVQLSVTEEDASYLYKMNKSEIVLNLKIIKQFQKFAFLFLLDALFIIARTLMQSRFGEFLKERSENGGHFFVPQGNADLPLDFADIFRLDDVLLMYAQLEVDKTDWHSVTLFDRRSFAFRAMESFLKLIDYSAGVDYLNYLKEDFVLCAEDASPEAPQVLEDNIVAKYKKENQLGFLEELELREKLFRHIENVLGE